MTGNFLDLIAWLSSRFQFLNNCFSRAVICQLFRCWALEGLSHSWHYFANCVLAHSYLGIPNIVIFWTLDYCQARGPWFCIGWRRLESHNLKSFTGSWGPPSVLHITCFVVLFATRRPPLRVLVGFTLNTIDFEPLSCLRRMKSSTYAS
jgi:hypothetical protein